MALEESASSCLLLLVSEKGGRTGLLLPALLFQERMGAKMEFPSARQGSESNAASPDVPERLQAIDALVRTC